MYFVEFIKKPNKIDCIFKPTGILPTMISVKKSPLNSVSQLR